MSDPYLPDYRIGDDERRKAIEDLGTHYAEGRLDFAEYDARLQQVAQIKMRSELAQMFDDLPVARKAQVPSEIYSAEEISQAYRSGRNIRRGIMALTTIATLAAISVTELGALIFIIPAVAVLLYTMKLGPQSWHTPSPKQLEMERTRELRAAQRQQILAVESEAALERAQRRAQRKLKQEELNSAATELATDVLKRFRQR